MPQTPAPPIAEKLAEKQKSISIAEFFEKNKQMLGFDSLQQRISSVCSVEHRKACENHLKDRST